MRGRGHSSVVAAVALALALCGCTAGASDVPEERGQETAPAMTLGEAVSEANETNEVESTSDARKEESVLQLMIGDTEVSVAWEDNESVEALAELVADEPLCVQMSKYGGFEQVGPLGVMLPSNDVQTTTAAGDIVLYAGNQIVVFYGSNSWAYTRLGHIIDRTADEMGELLGDEDVVVTISAQ